MYEQKSGDLALVQGLSASALLMSRAVLYMAGCFTAFLASTH